MKYTRMQVILKADYNRQKQQSLARPPNEGKSNKRPRQSSDEQHVGTTGTLPPPPPLSAYRQDPHVDLELDSQAHATGGMAQPGSGAPSAKTA